MIRLYQHLMTGRISPCRFIPTCSTYAYEAVETFGAVRGGLLAARRLARCHPWGGHGYDPVPDVNDDRHRACQRVEVSR